MKCPRCNDDLAELHVDEIVLDRCPRCAGIWFDFAEMERVLGKDKLSYRAFARAKQTQNHSLKIAAEELECPRCGEGHHLVAMRSSYDPEVTVLGCLVCYGRWLDGEELGRMRDKGLLAKMRLVFRELW